MLRLVLELLMNQEKHLGRIMIFMYLGHSEANVGIIIFVLSFQLLMEPHISMYIVSDMPSCSKQDCNSVDIYLIHQYKQLYKVISSSSKVWKFVGLSIHKQQEEEKYK